MAHWLMMEGRQRQKECLPTLGAMHFIAHPHRNERKTHAHAQALLLARDTKAP